MMQFLEVEILISNEKIMDNRSWALIIFLMIC